MSKKFEMTKEEIERLAFLGIIGPAQIGLHRALIKTLSEFGFDIEYNEEAEKLFLVNKGDNKIFTLNGFMSGYMELFEDFIINVFIHEFKENGKEFPLKSKIQKEAEKRAEDLKEMIGEEEFIRINDSIKKMAQANFEKDVEIADEIAKSKKVKKC